MRLTPIKNAITSKVGRQLLIAQKHSPVVLFGTGVIGFAATVVLATRATLQLEGILKEVEEKTEQVKSAEDISEEYSEGDNAKDMKLIRVQAAVKVCKLYAPAVAVGVASIAALTGSHVILSKRNVSVTAAYAVLDKGFKEYRARVSDEVGAEKETELYYGLVDREIVEETEEGPVVRTVKSVPPKGLGIYARCFDEYNRNWSKGRLQNQFFLSAQQQFATDKLRANGHLFLNEVYDALGIPRSSEGAAVGWILGEGDNYVDFGIFRGDLIAGQDFVQGIENSVWLDFNVVGTIWNKI